MVRVRNTKLKDFVRDFVAEIQGVHSTEELLSHPAYVSRRKELDELFNTIEVFDPPKAPQADRQKQKLKVVAWNVERGLAFEGIVESLKHHPKLSQGDVFLLTETDYGMARTQNRHVAQELCKATSLYAAFVPAYINLDKGSGAEQHFEGENTESLQGHTILSRYPLEHLKAIHLPNTKDHMAGKERQVGQEAALLASVDAPIGHVDVASIHLSAHSGRKHRKAQMEKVLKAFSQRNPKPSLLGGDWNTTTYNAHKAWPAILGFWVRVAMGVRHTIKNHYPYPERFFEKPLFQLLADHGFEVDVFNVPGGCTLHYDFNDPFVRKGLEDWLPQWCFKYVDWSLKETGGLCSFKLDWFAGKNLDGSYSTIVRDLPKGQRRFSDHDPILTDISPKIG